ncbi:stAR-related lipid transfer protein 7, mitochondrial isoform X1 [Athene cunicularia]|nr:stAR-related lipid transfer protein 7, mitochondrial isoform X1 [Athene cunicularia]
MRMEVAKQEQGGFAPCPGLSSSRPAARRDDPARKGLLVPIPQLAPLRVLSHPILFAHPARLGFATPARGASSRRGTAKGINKPVVGSRRWRERGSPRPVKVVVEQRGGAHARAVPPKPGRRSAQEMKHMENISSLLQGGSPGEYQRLDPKSEREAVAAPGEQPWEMIMDKKHFKLWRRPIEGTHLYQYRVFGSYTDVTPRQFFNVQLDTEYRKKWDSLVIKLDVIERDLATGSEVIHWVTHFPYPMYSRDYVYVRRYSVDKENNLMVLVSRAVEHPSVPEDPEYVRVRTYESQMVIRPHKTFDENGFDYLLTYSDNPQTVFPRYCVSWMVSSGMPDFLEKLHMAALKAKKMEIEVRDYMSAKPLESGGGSEGKATVAAAEHKSDGTCSPAQLEYA